jgi:hypothetical protein
MQINDKHIYLQLFKKHFVYIKYYKHDGDMNVWGYILKLHFGM